MERMCLRIAYRSSWDAYRSSWDAYRSSWDAYRSSWDAYRSSWDAYRSSWDAYRSSWDAYRSSSAKRPTCKQVGLFATYYFLFPPLTRKVPPISPSSLLMPLLLPVVLCTDSALFLNHFPPLQSLSKSLIFYFLFPPLPMKVPPFSPFSLLIPLLLPVVLCTDSALFLNHCPPRQSLFESLLCYFRVP